MGCWGCKSYDNDRTMDVLCSGCKNIYKPVQKEADEILKEEYTIKYHWDIGSVIWLLCHELKVNASVLNKALDYIKNNTEEVDCGWNNFESRKKYLKMEEQIIQSAIDNNGTATLKYRNLGGDILSMGLSVCKNDNELVPMVPSESK